MNKDRNKDHESSITLIGVSSGRLDGKIDRIDLGKRINHSSGRSHILLSYHIFEII